MKYLAIFIAIGNTIGSRKNGSTDLKDARDILEKWKSWIWTGIQQMQMDGGRNDGQKNRTGMRQL